MPNTVIQLKKSATPASVPSSLANGELAINFADGVLYYKAANGTIASISGSGGSSNYGVVNANGTLLLAGVSGDTFAILPGQNIIITGDAINDRVTIGADLTAANSWANTKLSNGTVTLAGALTTTGQITANAQINITPAGGQEGGEIQLQSTGANTNWSIDAYQNNIRIFTTTGTTVSNLNFFHAGSGSVRMGVNRADPGYTLDISGIVNASAIYVNGSPIGAGSMDYVYVNTSTTAANNYSGSMANSVNAWATATFGTITNTTAAFAAANQAGVIANAAFAASNSEYTFSNAVYAAVNSVFGVSNAAFGVANNALLRSGGTVTGDLVVQGNLTTSGVVTYANTQTLLIGDALITLNNDIPAAVAPSEDAGIEVKRGSSANVSLLWNEGSDRWTFTNDGTNYRLIASNTDVESANNYAGAMANSGNSWTQTIVDANLVTARAYTNTSITAANNYAGFMANSANAVATATFGTITNTTAAFSAANQAGVIANAAFAAGNNEFTFSNTIYAAVNSAFAVINAAYTSSNADYTLTNAAFTVANAAFGAANNAGTATNTTAAFAKANAALANTSGVYFNGNLFFPSGNVGIGLTTTTYKLEVAGSFAAQTKSFVISHPSKEGMFLRHGSLEGPENGVYVRGKVQGKVIELPDYWVELVDAETITVQLTAIGRSQNPYVVEVSNNIVFIDTENHTDAHCYYFIQAERKDVDKLVVEY